MTSLEDGDANVSAHSGGTTPVPTHKVSTEINRVVLVVILGAVMSALDTTIVNVALESLSRAFRSSLDSIQWVVTGYLLALAAAIPVCGWTARRFGARRVYLLSVAVFTAGSALCGLATSTPELVAFRVLQGAGGGMILPVGQIILVRTSGPARLARMMSTIGVPTIMAPLVGPTVGGLLIDALGWRWIFYVNVPIGIAALAAARWFLPDDDKEDAGRFDTTGFILVAVGLATATYGLSQIGVTGTAVSVPVIVPLASGIVLLGAYVDHSRRTPKPLLDLRLYANPVFTASAATVFFLGVSVLGGIILMPLYFQTVRHDDALVTGVLIIPQGLGAMISVWLSGRATDRFGAGSTAVLATLLTMVATIPFLMLRLSTPYYFLGPAMFFRGFSQGLSTMPCMTAAYRALKPSQISDASPQLNVLQRTGGSIGTAVFAVALQSRLSHAPPSLAGHAAAFGTTFGWVLIVTVVAAISALCMRHFEGSLRTYVTSGYECIDDPTP